jgi:hypothetical protein
MRPRRFSFTITDLDRNGYTTAMTGTVPAVIIGSPGDGCAHQTTFYSSADLRGITFTVIGTDANGVVQTETIVGPNATTANLAKYYKTLTSVTASATLGASEMEIGWTGLCYTPTIPVATYPHDGPVVSISPANITLTVQQTVSPIFNTAYSSVIWQTLIASGTAAAIAQALIGVTGIRNTITVSSSGTLSMDIAQARR